MNYLKHLVMNVVTDSTIIHGLSEEPYSLFHLIGVTGIGLEENKVHTKNITDLTHSELGITSDRYELSIGNTADPYDKVKVIL